MWFSARFFFVKQYLHIYLLTVWHLVVSSYLLAEGNPEGLLLVGVTDVLTTSATVHISHEKSFCQASVTDLVRVNWLVSFAVSRSRLVSFDLSEWWGYFLSGMRKTKADSGSSYGSLMNAPNFSCWETIQNKILGLSF